MMHPKKVGHVVLKVCDLTHAEQFYTEVLGFEVVTRTKRPRGVFFTLGQQHHDLAVLEVPPEAEPVKSKQIGLHHVALQVGSYDEFKQGYQTLKAHDVKITAAVDHGFTQSIYFLDPAGNQLELYYDTCEDGLERIRRQSGEADALNLLDLEA